MIGLEYFLFGYFLIEPKAEQKARVLDLLFSMKIGAKKIKSDAFILRKKHKKNLVPKLDLLGVPYTEERGLPHFIYKNRKRYSVFAAILLCFFVFVFISGRVFEIRVSGASKDTENAVLSSLSDAGLYPGVAFRSLDFSEIENGLKSACSSVAWVNLHRRGTVVYVNVIEKETEDSSQENALANLVASEDSVIVAVSPSSGVPCVKVGDAVKAGDLLVSAVYSDGTLGGASGEVLGRVQGEIFVEVLKSEQKVTLKRQKNVKIALNFFGFSINIFENYRNLPNGCDIIESNRQLRLLGRASMPISLSVQTAYLAQEQTVLLTEEEAIRLAEARLRASLSDLLSKGELVSMQTEGGFTERGYAFTLRYAQIRNVAEPKPIRTS